MLRNMIAYFLYCYFELFLGKCKIMIQLNNEFNFKYESMKVLKGE